MEHYKFALIGRNIGYSLSPEIFKCVYDIENVSGEFETIDCGQEELPAMLKEMKERGFRAASVTIPHKEAIIPHLDEVDNTARAIRSVNSVKFNSDLIEGFNTDVYGFSEPLKPYATQLKGKNVVALGAGGAARAIAYGLAANFEVGSITLLNRTASRLEAATAAIREALPGIDLTAHEWSPKQRLSEVLEALPNQNDFPALIVNCTPVGGPNIQDVGDFDPLNGMPSSVIYYDLSYNKANPLVKKAKLAGHVVIDGLPMLIHQALRSYYLWTGRSIDFDAVLNSLKP
ncbi:MAG: hypothetical protein IIB00_08650 [candidate division Zixibacteria bacterium]|nr:hypothetical protein [candidate division Zixibacteria bacterium]